MNRKLATSFEELIKGYYGTDGNGVSNAVKLQQLFATYYGQTDSRRSPRRLPSVVLSLTFDDGETLEQRLRSDHRQARSAFTRGGSELEEYVVEGTVLSRSSSVETRADADPREEVSALQEYQVDVLTPLENASRPAPVAARATPAVAQQPAPAAAEERPRAASMSDRVPSPSAGTSHSQAGDDDANFIADMQSILTGKKLFDPVSGRTVEKDKLGGLAASAAGSETAAKKPAVEVPNSNDVFQRIAQSMEYANTYDLGTVELNNRFADFDKIAELQEKAAQKRTASKARAVTGEGEARPAVGTEEFLQDLEAVRKSGGSTSQTISPSGYSQPFYDTGEHVLLGGDLYPDRLRVGKEPGVFFSYGQIMAMADLYESVDEMLDADVAELNRIKSLIERSTATYRTQTSDPAFEVDDEMWDAATRDRYLELAEANYQHFSPSVLFKAPSLGKVGRLHGDNKSAWEAHHRRAIEEARRMLLAPANQNVSVFLELPLTINAFGDHFLTDAFAAGHVFNKEETIASFKANFFDSKSLKPEAEAFFAKVAKLAFKGEVRKKFSVLETYDPKFLWWNPNIDTEHAFYKLLLEAANQQPDRIANVAVKALHDRLNKDGIEVFNDAGDGTWVLTGDTYLNQKNMAIARKAVQQSVDNIQDPALRASSLDFNAFFAKVWKHVPRLTEASFKRVIQLTTEYTRPDSDVLKQAAADLISRTVNSLIRKLKELKKLKDA